jgi:hypothetical protein
VDVPNSLQEIDDLTSTFAKVNTALLMHPLTLLALFSIFHVQVTFCTVLFSLVFLEHWQTSEKRNTNYPELLLG